MSLYQPIDPPSYGANQALSVLEAYEQFVFDVRSLGDRGPLDSSTMPLSSYDLVRQPGKTSLSRPGAVFTVAAVWLVGNTMDPDTIMVTIGNPEQGSVRRFRITTGYHSPRRQAVWLLTWMQMYFGDPNKSFKHICSGLRTMQTGQQPGQPAV